MPPDLPNEQALILKKRARRRLVGAIALVLLMIIILPRILQDRTEQTTQDAIKITMPEQPGNASNEEYVPDPTSVANSEVASLAETLPEPEVEPEAEKLESKIADSANAQAAIVKPEPKPQSKSDPKQEAKAAEVKPVPKPATQITAAESATGFTVQVGVFSDAANVKQLQEKLKQAGFNSYTEKISTPNGQKIRLRAGKFANRQEASDALNAIKSAGLSGMVISN